MGYCISVCIEKGGVGKTVTVCNLAALMAQDGKRVLVVDMDAQGNCTYTLTGARVTDNTFDRAGVYGYVPCLWHQRHAELYFPHAV